MNITRVGNEWLVSMDTGEAIMLFASSYHCRDKNETPNKDELGKVIGWLNEKLAKEKTLDQELEMIRQYEKSIATKTKNRKCKAKSNDNT